MQRRIQQALDGEVGRDELTQRELAELESAEALLTGLLHSLPSGDRVDSWSQVRSRINLSSPKDAQAGARVGHRRARWGLFSWLWEPRPVAFVVRPAYALAAAAILAAALSVGDWTGGRQPLPATGGAEPQVLVQFRLEAPHASQVVLAGGFTQWQPAHTMRRSEHGVWTVVVPLSPGIHDYAFVVDGERWVPDPLAPAVDDGFGGVNSRVAVLASDAARPL